jgi:hypothetical protein
MYNFNAVDIIDPVVQTVRRNLTFNQLQSFVGVHNNFVD